MPLKISNSGTPGSGITIHIEDSILNALIEKVPWTEVFESLNNKLSRTEETKHIKGTIGIHILRNYILVRRGGELDCLYWHALIRHRSGLESRRS